MDALRNNNKFNNFPVDPRKPQVDADIRITISRVHSTLLRTGREYVSLSEIIETIKDNNRGSAVSIGRELLKGLITARQDGYIESRRGKYKLATKGIDVTGEYRSERVHLEALEIKGIRYRCGR